jgi:hypothetical protein
MPATDIWPYAETIIKFFRSMLDDEVPRYIQGILLQEYLKHIWGFINFVVCMDL